MNSEQLKTIEQSSNPALALLKMAVESVENQLNNLTRSEHEDAQLAMSVIKTLVSRHPKTTALVVTLIALKLEVAIASNESANKKSN